MHRKEDTSVLECGDSTTPSLQPRSVVRSAHAKNPVLSAEALTEEVRHLDKKGPAIAPEPRHNLPGEGV